MPFCATLLSKYLNTQKEILFPYIFLINPYENNALFSPRDDFDVSLSNANLPKTNFKPRHPII